MSPAEPLGKHRFQRAHLRSIPERSKSGTLEAMRTQGDVQCFLQQRLMWITVPQMLSQTFGVIKAALLAITSAPPPRLFQVFVNAVMSAQPIALRLMTAQHFELVFERSSD